MGSGHGGLSQLSHGGLSQLTVVGGLEFCWWEVTDLAVQPVVVEPVDVAQGGEFDLVKGAPGSEAADQLGLEQPDGGLGQAVVVAVPDAADRGRGADLGQPFGVADRGVLPASEWHTRPSSRLARRHTAISRASRTSSVRMLAAARQATISREKTSITNAT